MKVAVWHGACVARMSVVMYVYISSVYLDYRTKPPFYTARNNILVDLERVLCKQLGNTNTKELICD